MLFRDILLKEKGNNTTLQELLLQGKKYFKKGKKHENPITSAG